ncbi:DUF4239 domain-containing protein [Microbacterium yannicii]|uniref:bestrophin-like domain n=1 Tax=Microbacterium yannicii TaxID=671622 RepID=UPI00178C7571|nr:DUF4239 domain-containing protein [Microbacterium yannicii]
MWVEALPTPIGLPLFVIVFVGVSLAIVVVLRRWVPRATAGDNEWDRVLGYAMASYGVLYGVTLALIAAATYENYRQVEEIVLHETSTVATLYRDVSGFPEPEQAQLELLVVDYTDHVIAVDWPKQAVGEVPSHTVEEVSQIRDILFAFEPETQAEAAVQLQTIQAFNQFVTARGERIGVTGLALPGLLWIVLGVGALLNAVLIGLVEMRQLRRHLVMAGIIAAYVGIVVFAVASFDRAYTGAVAVTPEYFIELRDWLFTTSE